MTFPAELGAVLRLSAWLVVLALAVLVAGLVIDQCKAQIATLARIPAPAAA